MGLAKATLPFGDETLLARVVRLLSSEVNPLVVVAAPDQRLPELPSDVRRTCDLREGRGPLEGLAAGLAALPAGCAAAYVTGCDVPLLVPAFVRKMVSLLGAHQIAVPREGDLYHPLAAVYRVEVLAIVQRLLEAGRLRPFYLFGEADTLEVPGQLLREADADLATLRNVNHPADYFAALAAAGLAAPAEILRRLQSCE